MSEDRVDRGLRQRLTAQTEEALGRLAQDLLENPLVHGALARAFDAREKATQAQEVAMGALNLPSAADVERLTRRVRSVSQRLEGIEDGVDRLEGVLGRLAAGSGVETRLSAIEEQLGLLTRAVGELRDGLGAPALSVALAQERLQVDAEANAAPGARSPAGVDARGEGARRGGGGRRGARTQARSGSRPRSNSGSAPKS